jgi:ribonuclease R
MTRHPHRKHGPGKGKSSSHLQGAKNKKPVSASDRTGHNRLPPRARTEHAGSPPVEGKLQHKGRFGFVLSETAGKPDLFITGPSLKLAMNGDRVLARTLRHGDRPEGEILSIVTHARTTVVGAFLSGPRPALAPEGPGDPVTILEKGGLTPKAGDLCVLRVTRWPTVSEPAAGVLTEILGRRNDPSTDLKFLLRKYSIPDAFPTPVEQDAASFGDDVSPAAWEGRKTFFDLPVFTIDGADAKDFDDAVSLEERPGGGWRLGVHIADVSHYVREGSALDQEARQRSTSVYLSGAVVPMLPFPLSDNLCSLRPHVPRLTLTCLMDLNANGEVTHHQLFESVIRSVRRFTYEEVESLLKGESAIDVSPPVQAAVVRMGTLARKLRERRFGRGSLDFDFPEPYIVVDDQGWPLDARRRERGESHKLIEEFMLLANETVAQAMADVPFLYRIHERPDPTKMQALEKTLRAVGVTVPTGLHDGKPAALQKVMAGVRGKPVEPMVHMMILRSLKQAIYSPKNAGHFGLASASYTHFTSPIRRYPDLIVHRLVKEKTNGLLTPPRQKEWKDQLAELTADASVRERVAVEAEREFLDLKRAQLMTRRVGETFDAVVTGVTSFGLFVQPTTVFVEGLVPLTELKDDYYIYDELRAQLRGRRTGRVYRFGQPVRVRLAAANTEKRQLDFALEPSAPRPNGPSRP